MTPRFLGLYWLLACGVLLAEYLLISFLFDAGTWLAALGPVHALSRLGDIATVGAVAAFGTLALRGRVIRDDLRAVYRPQSMATRAIMAVAHLLAYFLLLVTTSALFAVPDPSQVTAARLLAWLASALLVLLTLGLVMSPWVALRRLAVRSAPALGVGLLAGLLAFAFGQLSGALWHPLGDSTLHVVHYLLRQLTPDVVVDYETDVIGTPNFLVQVAPICSGYEGIGLICVFLSGYIVLNRRVLRFPQTLVSLPLAVVAVWSANVVRIVALILIGSFVSPQIALGGFHSKAGWVFFCLIALGFIAWLHGSPSFRKDDTAGSTAESDDDDAGGMTTAYLLPQLALLAATLLIGSFVHEMAWFYGLCILAALAALWRVRERLRSLWVRPSASSVLIGVVVFAFWYPLTDHYTEAGDELRATVMSVGMPLSWLWIAVRVLGSVLVVPVIEELAFRGFLMRRLIDHDFDTVPFRELRWHALLLSSLAFGALHSDFIAGTLAGVAYGYAQLRSGRLSDAVLAHAVTNALVCVDVLVFGAWAQW